jgi:beta-ribofuranosylaminobenzene 5'-phosphate synthase
VTSVVVTAPARLHFGMLDATGRGARRFGGFGVGITHPRVVVEAQLHDAPDVVVEGAQSERAATFARRCWARFGTPGAGVRIAVREAIPPHLGLGSGTKLGLAVARALAELAGVELSPAGLAEAAGRGARSSVGCWTFVAPGLVVEAGIRHDRVALSPLVVRHPMPASWRCVLALPGGGGLAGHAEERALERLRAPLENGIAHALLTELLPGLLDEDIEEFGAALTRIQRTVGSVFKEAQGGIYHPAAASVVDALLGLGVPGVGQSSWGPAVYGIVESPERAAAVAKEIGGATVVDFDRAGARTRVPIA